MRYWVTLVRATAISRLPISTVLSVRGFSPLKRISDSADIALHAILCHQHAFTFPLKLSRTIPRERVPRLSETAKGREELARTEEKGKKLEERVGDAYQRI